MRRKSPTLIHKYGEDIRFPRCISTSTQGSKRGHQQLPDDATISHRNCFQSVLRPALVRTVTNDEFVSNRFEKHICASNNDTAFDDQEHLVRQPLHDLSNDNSHREESRSCLNIVNKSNQLMKSSSPFSDNTNVSRTPTSLLRNQSKTEQSSNCHNRNKKKIQWDESILDNSRDVHKQQQSSNRKVSPITKMKRYDEMIQDDVSSFINHSNSWYIQSIPSPVISSDDNVSEDSASFTTTTTSCGSSSTSDAEILLTSKDSTKTSYQIAECIKDVLDQTMAEPFTNADNYHNFYGSSSKRYSHVSDISHITNETQEIAECVADINNQTMASYSNLRNIKWHSHHISNETKEIAECVADINNQTMVSYSNIGKSNEKESEQSSISIFDLSESEILQMSSIRIKESPSFNLSSEIPDQKRDIHCTKWDVPESDRCLSESGFGRNDFGSSNPRQQTVSRSNDTPSLNELAVSSDSSSYNDNLISSSESCGNLDNPFQMRNQDDTNKGEKHADVSVNLVKIGISLLTSEQYKEAIVTFREALRMRRKKSGDSHPLVAKIYNNMGVAFLMLNMYEKGLASFLTALKSHNNALRKVVETGYLSDRAMIEKFDLEIADMLCNVGSVCLDWLEKDHSMLSFKKRELSEKADHAFKRALTIKLHYLSPNSTQVKETAKICEEAQNIYTIFWKEAEAGNETEKSASKSIMQTSPQCAQILSSARIDNTGTLDVEHCIIKHSDTASYPFDEYTIREFPSDETSQMNISMFEPVERGNQSKISLFSSNGRPCIAGIIDSDVERYESKSCSGEIFSVVTPDSNRMLQLSQSADQLVEMNNTDEQHSLQYSPYGESFEQDTETREAYKDVSKADHNSVPQMSNYVENQYSADILESQKLGSSTEEHGITIENVNEDDLVTNPEKNANKIHNLATLYLQVSH
jgi:tetratricopeptide (TPR) repeat protein